MLTTTQASKQDAPSKEKQRSKLDKWNYDGERLIGIVYEHPTLPDGLDVRTSPVSWISLDMKLAETRNTVYILLEAA